MKDSLQPGIRHTLELNIGSSKTVPALYPESDEFVAMPEVFATGYLVGFIEWACIMALKPYLDWPAEQSVGTHIDISHEAATPQGLQVTADVELIERDGKRLVFAVKASDGIDVIARGRHERFIIDRAKFDARLEKKRP